jgi:hypothetical protein
MKTILRLPRPFGEGDADLDDAQEQSMTVASNEMHDVITRSSGRREDLLACLREHGVCVAPAFYPRDVTDRILAACVERVDMPGDTNFADGSYRRADAYRGTAAAPNERVYHVDCFSEDAGRFKQDPLLKAIAGEYYGTPHSVHVCIYERHRHNDIPVRGFHVDTFELSTFKVMLYLNDVTAADGPTCYIPGTHRNAELRRRKEHEWGPAVSPGDPSRKPHPTNFTDEELGALVNLQVPIIGAAGTIVLFDTWGVHRGVSPLPGAERHVLVNYYRMGADLPPSDFGFDAAADYKRYALDYKKYRDHEESP